MALHDGGHRLQYRSGSTSTAVASSKPSLQTALALGALVSTPATFGSAINGRCPYQERPGWPPMWIQFLLQGFGRLPGYLHEMGLAPLPGPLMEVLAIAFDQSPMMVGDDNVGTQPKSPLFSQEKIPLQLLRFPSPPIKPKISITVVVHQPPTHHTGNKPFPSSPHLHHQSVPPQKGKTGGCPRGCVRSQRSP